MSIQPIHTIPLQSIQSVRPQQTTPAEAQKQFGQFLKEALHGVNEAQNNADRLTNQLIHGEPVHLHDVMIAAQKASITLNLALEVRNKVVEAYQEVMRMQI